MATEQVAQLLAAIEQLNARVLELERQGRGGEPGDRRRGGLVDKGIQPGTFNGQGYHNWAEDFIAIVGAKNESISEAMKWGESKGDNSVTIEEATLNVPHFTETDARELYVYLMHHLLGEPRIIAKGANGNGIEAWRKLKMRYDPVSETSQVNVLLQVLQPTRARNVKETLSCIEKWEEGMRRQQTITGAEPLTDGTKRALLIKMCPAEMARHLQLNARHLDTYEKMRWEVVNYIQLIHPSDPVAMEVDYFAQENYENDVDEYEACYIVNEKGKGKGKGKYNGDFGGTKGKGKSGGKGIKGNCWLCGEHGHRAADCPKKGGKAGKGKGKAKGNVDNLENAGQEIADTGSIEVIDMFSLDTDRAESEVNRAKEVDKLLKNVRRSLPKQENESKSVEQILLDVRKNIGVSSGSNALPPPPPPPPPPAATGLLAGRFRSQGLRQRWATEKNDEKSDANDEPKVETQSAEVQASVETTEASTQTDEDVEVREVDGEDFDEADDKDFDSDEVSEQDFDEKTKLFDLDALDDWGNEILTVTVDSGAAESVIPVDLLPGLPMVDKPAERRYRAAGGKLLEDKGAKKVTYWGPDGRARSMTFRVAEVNKPLASVKRICDKGNRVIFDGCESRIEHKMTGHCTPIREERGVYVLDVPMADINEEGFSRQGK